MLDWASVERKNNYTMSQDDLAMIYEIIIRKCFGCTRYDENNHGADASLFRKMLESYVCQMSAKTDDQRAEYKKEYIAAAKVVLSSLLKAMQHVKRNALANEISSIMTADPSIFVIIYLMGRILAELQLGN